MRWTYPEELVLIRLWALYGSKYWIIAKYFPHRTRPQIKAKIQHLKIKGII